MDIPVGLCVWLWRMIVSFMVSLVSFFLITAITKYFFLQKLPKVIIIFIFNLISPIKFEPADPPQQYAPVNVRAVYCNRNKSSVESKFFRIIYRQSLQALVHQPKPSTHQPKATSFHLYVDAITQVGPNTEQSLENILSTNINRISAPTFFMLSP